MTSKKVTFSDANNGLMAGEKQNLRRPSRTIMGHRLSISSAPGVRRKKSSVAYMNSGLLPLTSMMAVEQQLSTLGRNHFLRSFGKDTLYGYEGVEKGVLPDKSEEITEKQRRNLMEFILKKDSSSQRKQLADNEEETRQHNKVFQRSASAGTLRKKINTEWVYEDILELRGKNYSGDPYFDIKEKIRSQSARRRFRRIMLADKEKEQKEKEQKEKEQKEKEQKEKEQKEKEQKEKEQKEKEQKEKEQKEKEQKEKEQKEKEQKEKELAKKNEESQIKKKPLRGDAIAILTIKATTGSFDMFLEKKKWLTERRKKMGQIAIRRFRWAVRVVRILCKVIKVISSLSTIKTPETAAQRSWYALKHSSEAKEILFNMTIFQKGKSQYAYIPDWAKNIFSKTPMERTDIDLGQVHSLLKGLQAYDKFTYRIQMAMCRAMIYQKVENRRVILRKGHEGMAFYFIFSGSVFINVEELLKKSGHVVWHTSVVLSRGDSFGELALLRRIKRTATVVVREDVELLVVDRDVFAITCPKIYDKELVDKIRFCKSLDIFNAWTDDMLRNICFEAQIQEWRANKIIVNDSSKETEWIYICMQGKCSVIKALDLKISPGTVGPRKVIFDEPYFTMFGKKGGLRAQNSTRSDAWKKDLEKGFKQSFSFAHHEKSVDENNDSENESSESESDIEGNAERSSIQGESTKERILEVMALPYSNMPHAKGDSQYCEVDEEISGEYKKSTDIKGPKYAVNTDEDQSQLVLEKKIELESFTLLDLMSLKHESGTLNKDVAYLTIASMQPGDIFDLSEILMPTGRKLMLVSKGTVILRIKRVDYLRYSNKLTLKHARDIALATDYPSDEILYRSYNDHCAWESYKRKQMSSAMKEIQDVCTRHHNALQIEANFIRKPPKDVEGILTKGIEERLRLQELDSYLNFVYSANKGVAE